MRIREQSVVRLDSTRHNSLLLNKFQPVQAFWKYGFLFPTFFQILSGDEKVLVELHRANNELLSVWYEAVVPVALYCVSGSIQLSELQELIPVSLLVISVEFLINPSIKVFI